MVGVGAVLARMTCAHQTPVRVRPAGIRAEGDRAAVGFLETKPGKDGGGPEGGFIEGPC